MEFKRNFTNLFLIIILLVSIFSLISLIQAESQISSDNYIIKTPETSSGSDETISLTYKLISILGTITGNIVSTNYKQFLGFFYSSTNRIPTTPTPNLVSLDGSNHTSQDLNCSDVLEDLDGDDMNVTVRWYKDDVLNFTLDYNNSYSNGNTFSAILDSGNLSHGDSWICSLRLYDSQDYSNWGNSSALEIRGCNPPVTGNWEVDGVEVCKNMEIVVQNHTYVRAGDDLTFDNVTFYMNETATSGARYFYVYRNFTAYGGSQISNFGTADADLRSEVGGIINLTNSNTTNTIYLSSTGGMIYLDNAQVKEDLTLNNVNARLIAKDSRITDRTIIYFAGTSCYIDGLLENVYSGVNVSSSISNFEMNLTNTYVNNHQLYNNGGTLYFNNSGTTSSPIYRMMHYNYDADNTTLENTSILQFWYYGTGQADREATIEDFKPSSNSFIRNITTGKNLAEFKNSKITEAIMAYSSNANLTAINSTLYYWNIYGDSYGWLINSTVTYSSQLYGTSVNTITNSFLDSGAYTQIYDFATVNFTLLASRVDELAYPGGATESNKIYGYFNITSIDSGGWVDGHIVNRFFPFIVTFANGSAAPNYNVSIQDTEVTINSGLTGSNGIVSVNITYNGSDGFTKNYNVYLNDVFKKSITMRTNTGAYGIPLQANTQPETPTPTLVSLDGSNKTTQDLNCSYVLNDADADDMNVTVQWYKDDVLNFTLDYNNSYTNGVMFSAILESENTTKHDNWTCGLRLYDGIFFSDWGNSSGLEILNSLPTVTLTAPQDNNITTDRTPTFTWAGTDNDGDTISYEINITDYQFSGGAICTDDRKLNLSSSNEYTPSIDLKCLYDNGYQYKWQVRANDSETVGAWSSTYTLNITANITVFLNVSDINFGSLDSLTSNDTTDNSPSPLLIQNNGNTLINISTNASDPLWSSNTTTSDYFKFKIDNSTELGSFKWLSSLTSWTNVPITGNAIHSITELNYSDSKDTAEIDLYIEVPPNEAPGFKDSLLIFQSSLGE